MNAKTQLALGFLAPIMLASANALASPDSSPIFLSSSSPDHPSTLVAGDHLQMTTLRWDWSHQWLVVDVKYSNQHYADSVNPSQTEYFTLAFPNVRRASNGTDLIATNLHGDSVRIGQIKDGPFGKVVVLRNRANLYIHCVDGRIHAALIYNALEKE